MRGKKKRKEKLTLVKPASKKGSQRPNKTVCKLIMNPSVETVLGSTLIAARFEFNFATEAKNSKTDSRVVGEDLTRFEMIRKSNVYKYQIERLLFVFFFF